ncbi:hypothetical protein [Alkalibacterium olivapovliticus]|uniref:Uncharacterized protein n=1 Tax=Alkalibacterium olivapovliticus TaxID=99907 RepID=A0A2T0VTF6_9LACT|nr:hypothetical protein [Alkalibacterium olivapovliticus]PRY74355.1 hypothetical protein CLV38_1432 [Alkalibacterium olivapovliticus]
MNIEGGIEIFFQNEKLYIGLEAINETLIEMSNISIIDIVNFVGVIASTIVAIISIYIAMRSLKFSADLEEKRNNEITEEKEEYLKKVDTILTIILKEIEQIIEEEISELSNKTKRLKKRYIKKSNTYTVQQVKSRLDIICSFEFSTMDSEKLKDLYDIRTLVAGLYNTFYGFEKNLNDRNFILDEYERYLKDILIDMKEVSSNLYMKI